MIKHLKYMDIEYTDSDLEYIDFISKIIDENSEKIVNFFELDNYDEKTYVKLFSSLEEFKKYYKEVHGKEPRDWVCGFAINKNVYTLTLNEYRKTRTHENHNVNALIKLILHEFTHSVHMRRHSNITFRWISEGAATYLSGQYEDSNKINCTYEEIINYCAYSNYRFMFDYVLKKYGKEYILKLIDDEQLLEQETKRLFEETSNQKEMYVTPELETEKFKN